MNAVILMGGLGTRLRPLTLKCPKPLVPILNRPFISYQFDQLKRHRIREVVLALGHRAAHFRRHLGDGRRWGLRFIYSIEAHPLGTGGAIRKALPHVRGPAFILNGDVLSDIDLGRLAAAHRAARADATLALTTVENPSSYGLVELTKSGRVKRFLEKPAPNQITTKTISAGCYLFERSVIEAIPAGRMVSVERETFPQVLRAGGVLAGYIHRGYWSDIGTLYSYWRTHMDLAGTRFDPNGRKSARPRAARVEGRLVLGVKTRVGAGAVFLGKVVIGAGCRIGKGSVIKNSVILEGSRIGENARVESSVLGENVNVGDGARVGPWQAVGGGTRKAPFSQFFSEPKG